MAHNSNRSRVRPIGSTHKRSPSSDSMRSSRCFSLITTSSPSLPAIGWASVQQLPRRYKRRNRRGLFQRNNFRCESVLEIPRKHCDLRKRQPAASLHPAHHRHSTLRTSFGCGAKIVAAIQTEPPGRPTAQPAFPDSENRQEDKCSAYRYAVCSRAGPIVRDKRGDQRRQKNKSEKSERRYPAALHDVILPWVPTIRTG